MRVYKLIDAHWGEEALRRRRLKLSKFGELNDPFEGANVHFSDAAMMSAWIQARDLHSKDHGQVSFSTRWDNPVLWGHYADCHKGMALGFEIDEGKYFRKVDYRDSFLDGDGFANWEDTKKRDLLIVAYSTKHSNWSYESEVRATVKLEGPDPYSKLHFIDFSSELALKEVIIGSRFIGDLPYLKRCVLDVDGVEFIKAAISVDSYDVIRSI